MKRWRGGAVRWTAAMVTAGGVTAGVMGALPGSHSTPVRATSSGISLLPAAGQFMPLDGTAVLDSRYGTGVASPSLTPGSTLTFSVRSVGGVTTGVPADAGAVVLEYNVLGNFPGFLVSGAAAATADTSISFPPNVERNGFDIVPVASDGTVAVTIKGYTPVPSNALMSRVVVRLHGYYTGASSTTPGSTYVGYDPALLADTTASPSGVTLNGTATSGPLIVGTPSGGTDVNAYTIPVAGQAGVPADGSATAVALQVNILNPSCSGEFALVPGGSTRADRDGAFAAGDNAENFDLVELPSSGQLTLRLLGCSGTADVLIRVRGYYSAPTSTTPGASFTPTVIKLLDTTDGTGVSGCTLTSSGQLPAQSGCTVPVLGVGDIPTQGVSGIAAEVVTANANQDGWVGLFSDASVAHTASDQAIPGGRTSNFEIATYTTVSDGGSVYVYNGGGSAVDVVVRVHGYQRAPNLPGAPTGVTVSTDGTTTTVSWQAPTSDGGAAIGGFIIDGEDDTRALADWPATSVTVPTVQGDIGYSVMAVNGVGVGAAGLSGCDAWRGALPTASPADTTSPDPVDSSPVAGPSKQAALSASPTETTLPSPSASDVIPCAASTADPTTVAAIKADALNDLHLDLYAMRQPTTASGQLMAEYPSQEGTVTDSTTMDTTLQSEAQGASSAWSSGQAAAQVNQRYEDAREAYADPDYVGYTDAKTVVDQWQSVQLASPTTATAVFVGHDSFRSTTGWHDDQAFQFQLALVLESGHWRLVSRDELDLGIDAPDN